MRALITGVSGLVGHLITTGLNARGWTTLRLGRRPQDDLPYGLGDAPDLPPADMLVHCAFDHLPGRYRGGEGRDPDGFRKRNLDGTLRLAQAVQRRGIRRFVFLSSRAVYGTQTQGAALTEDTTCAPDTLYGTIKLETETALAAMADPDFVPIAIRATGVYGPPPPGRRHKWADLFADFLAGREIAARVGTEVHGDDLAAAVALMKDAPPGPCNISDIVLDRNDLLRAVMERTGRSGVLPPRADASALNVMATDRLQSLGWSGGGIEKLRKTLPDLLTDPASEPC